MKHVLVVDDDLLICDVTRQLLQIPGLQCHSARNYEQAVRVIEKCCPDLILLDLHLPGMSGVEISRRIRELPTGSQPQIVAFTGDAVRDVTEFASEHGFDDIICKPFRVADFNNLIQRCLERQSAKVDQ